MAALAVALLCAISPASAAGSGSLSGAIAAGPDHSCGVLTSGAVTCWGRGDDGRLGYGSTAGVADGIGRTLRQAGAVPVGAAVTAVAVGDAHTCALLQSGAVRCWGADAQGQLGYSSTQNVGDGAGPAVADAPNVALPGSATAIAAGGNGACALLEGGAVSCWGDTAAPHTIDLPAAAVSVATNGNHSCAALSDGTADCWTEGVPTAVALTGSATQVAVGASKSCAVLADGSVDCWGADGKAAALALRQSAVDVVLNADNGCALLADRSVSCWSGSAAPAATGVTAAALAVGANDVCTLADGGALDCWGDGAYGKLGRGDVISRTSDGKAVKISNGSTMPTTTMTFGGGSQAAADSAAKQYSDAIDAHHAFPWWAVGGGLGAAAVLAAVVFVTRRRLAGARA